MRNRLSRSVCRFLAAPILALCGAAHAAPVAYEIVTIGPTDAEHTRSTDTYRASEAQQINAAGDVIGFADRFDGATATGRSAWLYDGAATINVGLTDTEHTRSTDGYRYSVAENLNAAGAVSGYSRRYAAGGANLGRSAWFSDGTTSTNIGLTDTVHTRDTDGYRFSAVQFMNDAGNVAGYANRYEAGGDPLGRSAWLFSGSSTVNIGLTNAEHTSSTDGERFSSAQALNASGEVLGYADRFGALGVGLGRSAWLYDGSSTTNISLTDAEHTRSSDNYRYSSAQYLNAAGQAVGFASRYNAGGAQIGTSAWLYDGSTTTNISLADAEHTRSTDNYRFSSARALNDNGAVAGYAERFAAGGAASGRSAWIYDGSGTTNIGLTDAEHTKSTDGFRYSDTQELNNAGQVIGYANRYGAAGAGTGRSAWLYDGSSTVNVGLTGSEHTRSTDDYKYGNAQFLGSSGNAIGYSERYAAAGAALGRSAWFYDGSSTADISLTDATHTRSTDGYRFSYAEFMNSADQAAGFAYRYGAGGGFIGQSAWYFNGTATIALNPLSLRSDGYAYSDVAWLGDDGLLLGTYTLFDGLDNNLGSRAFWFTEAEGVFDLGTLVGDSFTDQDWGLLATAVAANLDQLVIGAGLLTDMSSGSVAYLLQPAVIPVPPALWLFVSALGLLGWRRKNTAT